MATFDLSKKFETGRVKPKERRIFIDGSESCKFELCAERKKKGCQYAESHILEELQMNKLKLKNVEEIKNQATDGVDDLELTSVGTRINIHDLEKDKVHNIYKEYYENKKKPDSDLIIQNYKKKILSLIETNEVTILTGPTGCGKTTQVPQFILDSYIEQNKYCNIVVTQPRRIAAISIAKRVCDERSWPLGTLCGYKVGLKNCTSKDTLLTYMTVGVLLQTLIKKKNMDQYTHILLDEVHERDQSMDFTLVVVKKLLNISQHVKIILMSATVDAMKFANYFQKFYLGGMQCAPIINVNMPTNFAVQIHYLDELSALGDLPDINFQEPRISDLNFDICIRLIKKFEKIDNDETRKNSVLVFLPGIYEIEYLHTKLMDPKIHSAGAVHYKWSPLPLHSSITTEEQAQVFLPPPTGYRKIILSTNIAESSITVPGVKFVIDFCLTRCLRTDTFTNYCCLQLCWASQANCIQRAGRVGRVMEGRVYRMVYKHFYEGLEKEAVPEILTSPLDRVVLQSKMLDMGEPKAILALALDPPDLSNIESTILILKEVGGLLKTRMGISTPYDGDLTFLGRLMAVLPVDIRITRLIVFGYLFSCLRECIIMGASMSLKSVFSHPFKNKLKAYNSKLDWADGSCSDCIAFLNVYEVWCNNHENGYFKRSKGDSEISWAKRHFIQLRVLREVKLLVEEITMRLKENLVEESMGCGKVQWNEYQKALVLKVIIAGAFYPNYFGRGIRGVEEEKLAVKLLGGRNPFTTVYLNSFPHQQPLDLYSQLIKEELSECKEEMKISSDGSSKVYIQFRKRDVKFESGTDMPFDGTLPGKIPMAVYRAVKLRQIRKSVNIKVLPLEEALQRAKLLGIKSYIEIWKEEQEGSEINQLIPYNVPGIDVSCLPLMISYMIDPGHFWANDLGNSKNQKRIFHLLNTRGQELDKYDKLPAVGEMCIAPYEENGETWLYRARVESIYQRENNPAVQVFFVDYGNSAIVDAENLKKYSPRLLDLIGKIPAQAFECMLSEIRPSLIMNSKGHWSEQARAEFEKLTNNEPLFGTIYSVVNGIVSLELFKTNGDKQMSINKYLVSEGYAEITEESYLSKMNNEIRRQRQSEMDQKDLHNNLLQHEVWGENYIEPPEAKDCKISLQLRGPYSPLEMRIYPYTLSSLGKSVIICEESVNSVLLDTDPQDSHERLIVAGFINQTPEGSKLVLNNTTVMPNIHGLAAIIPFIFAPEIELRVNKERTRYVGMLCGLGADDDGVPIFPEHDFEVRFDTEITYEDFQTVNSLRFFMSLLLLTEEDESHPNLSFPDINKFQRKIKTNLLSLLTKQRKSKEVEFPMRGFQWGLFPCDLTVDSAMAARYSHLSIFRFHSGITINPE